MNGDSRNAGDRDRSDREKLEILDGSRGVKTEMRRRQAVRVSDMQGFLDLPAKLKSAKAAGSTPTKAEFDALVDDVTMLFNKLRSVADALQAKILP